MGEPGANEVNIWGQYFTIPLLREHWNAWVAVCRGTWIGGFNCSFTVSLKGLLPLKCPTTCGVAAGRALSGRGVTPSWESRGGGGGVGADDDE